jgi:hypothetical protein
MNFCRLPRQFSSVRECTAKVLLCSLGFRIQVLFSLDRGGLRPRRPRLKTPELKRLRSAQAVDITPSEVMTLRTMFGDTADPAKVEEAIANGGAGFPGHNGYADRVEIHGMSHVSTRVSAAAKPHLES